jgi:HEAT repeat protein
LHTAQLAAELAHVTELVNQQPELAAAHSTEDEVPELIAEDLPALEDSWMDVSLDEPRERGVRPLSTAPLNLEAQSELASQPKVHEIEVVREEKGLLAVDEESAGVPSTLLGRLKSEDSSERAAVLMELGHIGDDDSFRLITKGFDDHAPEVRNAAARSLFNLHSDRAASFTRALREATPERRRKIGAALAESGLATQAINNLTGESRERTYDAFSLLFLMAKAGEVHPLMRAIEDHGNIEVRLAVVKLLALSGQSEIVPAFRRLAVRGSLPAEVRSAVMEAIYQISSQSRETTSSAA